MIPLEQYFINEERDFFNYMMESNLFKNKKTYRDYISRLKYVSTLFRIDHTLTKEKIADIIISLKETIPTRDKYNSEKGVSDIASGLYRFLEYVQSDYKRRTADSIIQEEQLIIQQKELSTTEKEAIIKSRIGQGLFRNRLYNYWKCCAVTGCLNTNMLMASHIRPWSKSNNYQRLDVFNGLLLIPNLDKLFDKGYISFQDNGKIICSNCLLNEEKAILGVNDSMRISQPLTQQHIEYLKYHRDYCLM